MAPEPYKCETPPPPRLHNHGPGSSADTWGLQCLRKGACARATCALEHPLQTQPNPTPQNTPMHSIVLTTQASPSCWDSAPPTL